MINKDAIGLDIRLDTGDVWGQLFGYFSEAQKVFSNIYMIGKEISGAIGKTFPSMEWPTKAISEDTSAIVSCLQEIELAVSDGFDQLATQSEKEGAKDAIFKGWEIAKDFYEKVPQNKKSSGGGKYLRKETDDGDGLLGIAANADMLTAGLAELTAAWDSEAIAKAASTAAQWAQTAAVTAWNGICGAASPGRLKTVLYRSTRNYAGRDNFCRVWLVITRIRRLNDGPYPGGLERGAQPLAPRSGYRSGDKKLSAAAYRPSPRAARGIQRMEKPGQIWPR